MPVGEASTGEVLEDDSDWRESFNVGREPEVDEDPPYANVWPDAAALPGFRQAVLMHQTEQLQLAVRLRGLIALALGTAPDFFDAPGLFDRPLAILPLTDPLALDLAYRGYLR